MKLKIFYISTLLFFMPLVAFSQTDYFENDSIVITLKDFTGTSQWQKSYDTINWVDITGETKDSILFIVDSTTLFRVKVVHGICNFYSDTVLIDVKRTPILETTTISSITENSAIIGGNVISDGGAAVTDRGVCWSTSPNPTTLDSISIEGSGIGSFLSNINNLDSGIFYYVRAYATNSFGTAYGNENAFMTIMKNNLCPGVPTVIDSDGNIYFTVQIGNQCWMAENLNVTHYPNGDTIPLISIDSIWDDLLDDYYSDAYCYYNNNATGEASIYGALYTYAAAIGDSWPNYDVRKQGVCPDGWHLPTSAEWDTLNTYLGTNSGSKLAGNAALWQDGNLVQGEDFGKSDFSALPGGRRYYNFGTFEYLGEWGTWWCSSQSTSQYSHCFLLTSYSTNFTISKYSPKSYGHSVRCVRD